MKQLLSIVVARGRAQLAIRENQPQAVKPVETRTNKESELDALFAGKPFGCHNAEARKLVKIITGYEPALPFKPEWKPQPLFSVLRCSETKLLWISFGTSGNYNTGLAVGARLHSESSGCETLAGIEESREFLDLLSKDDPENFAKVTLERGIKLSPELAIY